MSYVVAINLTQCTHTTEHVGKWVVSLGRVVHAGTTLPFPSRTHTHTPNGRQLRQRRRLHHFWAALRIEGERVAAVSASVEGVWSGH